MLPRVFFIFLIGCLLGSIFEFVYRSTKAEKITIPLFVNIQMYGVTGAFLAVLHFLDIPTVIKLILMFAFPTFIEFITGYLYLRTNGIYPWDYSKEPYNYKNLICLRFSLLWFIISLFCYYLIIPVFL